MGVQIDPDAVRDNGSNISVFGRVASAMQIFCTIGVALGSSGSYPADGASTITFDAALKANATSQCDMDLTGVTDGTTIGFTVTTPSSTTNFDRKIVIDLTNIGSGTQEFYFKADASDINIATTESNSNGISRTVVFYDLTTKVIRAEYVSGPNTADLDDLVADSTYYYSEFYRLFYDETNDNGYMMHIGGQDSNTGPGITLAYTAFVLAGKPNTTGGTFSLSMDGQYLDAGNEVKACVNKDTGDLTTDGARCGDSATGRDGYDVTSEIGTLLSGYDTFYGNTKFTTIGETTTLNFTDATNLATAAISTL